MPALALLLAAFAPVFAADAGVAGRLPGRALGSAALGAPEPAPPAQGELADLDSDVAPFKRSEAKVGARDLALLEQAGYRFNPEGLLFAPDSDAPLGQTEFAFVLEDLRSRKKLTALLQLNLIFNRYSFKRKAIPPAEQKELKRIGSENWELLSKSTRRDLRPLFNNEEIRALDARAKGPDLPTPPAAFELVRKAPVIGAARGWTSASPAPVFPGISPMDPIPPRLLSLYLSRPPADPGPAEEKALPAPWAAPARRPAARPYARSRAPAPPSEDSPLPAPWIKPFSVASAAPPPVAAARGFDESVAKIRPVFQAQALPVPARSALLLPRPREISVATLPRQPDAEYPAFDPQTFAAFVEGAPYSKEVKGLLTLLAKHAKDPERRAALGALRLVGLHVVVDSRKAGTLPAAYSRMNGEPNRLQLALSDGALLVRTKGFFGGGRAFLLPDAPELYRQRGLPPPAWKAADHDAPPAREEADALGLAKAYADGSLRLTLSSEQLAGTLFKELLRLDASLRGWDSDPYRTELRITAAQMRFYSDVEREGGARPRLDREMRARYRAWLERPEEHEDFILQALSARRVGWVGHSTGSPRDEVAAIAEAGAADPGSARRAMDSLPESREEKGSLEAWAAGLAAPSEAQAAWLGLERRARAAAIPAAVPKGGAQ